MNFNNGILSIQDPKGRYMGMQDIATGYLTGRNINICTQGPKDDPTAIIVEVSAEEDKFTKEEDKSISRMKGDYKKNATPKMFSILLNNAAKSFDIDKKYNRGNTYKLYNNGFYKDITQEEFYIDTCDFRLNKPKEE